MLLTVQGYRTFHDSVSVDLFSHLPGLTPLASHDFIASAGSLVVASQDPYSSRTSIINVPVSIRSEPNTEGSEFNATPFLEAVLDAA
jgi:hypothetical protein